MKVRLPMPRMVFARSDGFVTHPETGLRVHLRRNQPWPEDDPLVEAKPDLFATLEELSGVEQASSAPGERRRSRRVTP